MTTRLTPHTITEAINFVVADNARKLGQIITDVQDADLALYKQYHIARPLLSAAYQTAHNQLQGQLLMLLDHHKIVEQIKAAQQICQQEWQLHDFQIVALQRPGTKPPFHLERAA